MYKQKIIKLSFFSQVRKQFKLLTVSFKPLCCCFSCLRNDKLVNCHVWKLAPGCKDLTFAWFDPSIKSYFLMVSFPILLRSLRVYILKQLLFSISVNSGFRNIYAAWKIFTHYSPRFQRIIVKSTPQLAKGNTSLRIPAIGHNGIFKGPFTRAAKIGTARIKDERLG